ncbi:hypothetical protein [Streptococcus macacae]|uniref:Uncharacterized protein n=1 Tax=Streptococcus macacae NCTC 11558 TaxID=764298 RepID=G5JWQ9_9STRE|nr:hypothetical protein [Streptococcus macacae]EHJ52699.1 hypothetical protein STRMA_1195 [Streptococcus macacae NCTC 11558]SUN79019.1 signal peptide containing protein [Streptococcus macacae NCTC 11558]
MKKKKLVMLMAAFIVALSSQHLLFSNSGNHFFNTATASASTLDTDAEKAVKKLEDHQKRENLVKAQQKVDTLSDVTKKEKLQHRIDLVEQAIIIKEAQTAVKYLEDHQDRNNIADAQNKTALVTDEGTKANLTNRINLVENAIAVKEAQASENTVSAQEDRTVYVTGGGKSKVYWYSTDSMPWNTNKNNIIQMKESQAIAAGKRHSLTEP